MSERIWITAKSELIPFEELTDEHLANAIDWCKIRLREIPGSFPTHTSVATRIASVAFIERGRVKVLLAELEEEQTRRKPKPYATLSVNAHEDTIVNGVLVSAGTAKAFTLEKEGANISIRPSATKSLKDRIDTCTGAELDKACSEIAAFGWGSDYVYARNGEWKETDERLRKWVQSTNGYLKGVCKGEYAR